MNKGSSDKTSLILEVGWEVCNQQGGIYTVLRTKASTAIKEWGKQNYFLIGPYIKEQAISNFDVSKEVPELWKSTLTDLQKEGYQAHIGHWAINGKPQTILLDIHSCYHELDKIKYIVWQNHNIAFPDSDDMLNQVVAFGFLVSRLLELFSKYNPDVDVLAHFHEWMGGLAIPLLRHQECSIPLIFTTHATLLGRYLAMNDPKFYDRLNFYDWLNEAHHFNIETAVRIERAAAHGSHVFTTVSDVTAKECQYLLGRKVDFITPNGLNIKRFEAVHEFQNLHLKYKNKINEFIIGHFFPSYHFDLDKTLYFFTSGRYEYRNKGFDIIIEALARLNYRLQQTNSKVNIVMFFITRRPYQSFNHEVMQSRIVMSEIVQTCKEIAGDIEKNLFYKAAAERDVDSINFNDFISEYNFLKLKRTLQSWKISRLPSIVTHNLIEGDKDEILKGLRRTQLINKKEDKVKVIYHPDFLSYVNPLFSMEYTHFVRGCHLGIFPSYYEPWGYTPLECTAMGLPSITSDLSGFGNYIAEKVDEKDREGLFIIERQDKTLEESIEALTDCLFKISTLNRRTRINLRNRVENESLRYDWSKMIKYYKYAYEKAGIYR